MTNSDSPESSAHTPKRGRARAPVENAIERNALRERARKAADPIVEASGEPARSNKKTTAKDASSAADWDAVPQRVRERFVNLGRKYFLPDGELAFQDHGHKLTTASENTEIIGSLVAIARARGWQEIRVSGTESFRRAAWQHAMAVRMEVRGYTPTPLEEVQLTRTLARREPADPERNHEAAEQGASVRAGSAAAPALKPAPRAVRAQNERLLFGELLDHGRENYQFNPHEDTSYFAKVKTDRREVILWGQDLERALRESQTQPQIGDRVGVRQIGQEAVTVRSRERDAEGRVLRVQPVKTHRNTWQIETEAFFRERAQAADLLRDAQIDPRRAVHSHPQLVGSYLAMGAAEKIAAQRFADPEDRRRFVAMTREALATAIARGDPLLSPKLRERVRAASEGKERASHPAEPARVLG